MCSQVNQNLEKIRQREGDTHQSYKHIAPVYAIAIVDSNYFSDDLAFHSFSMREDTTGDVLTITNNGQENHLVKMAFLELKKYRETSKDKVRKPWLEFFGNKPFTQEPERAISQADQLLNYKSWSEEDRKMFSQLRMREEQALLAQDYALETARAEGGFVMLANLVRQGLLPSEVASQQLGMTVAEFEALLWVQSLYSRKFMKWQVLSKYLPFLLDFYEGL